MTTIYMPAAATTSLSAVPSTTSYYFGRGDGNDIIIDGNGGGTVPVIRTVS